MCAYVHIYIYIYIERERERERERIGCGRKYVLADIHTYRKHRERERERESESIAKGHPEKSDADVPERRAFGFVLLEPHSGLMVAEVGSGRLITTVSYPPEAGAQWHQSLSKSEPVIALEGIESKTPLRARGCLPYGKRFSVSTIEGLSCARQLSLDSTTN